MMVLLVGDRCGSGGGTSGQLALAAAGLARRGHAVFVLVAEPGTAPGQKLRIRDHGKVCSCCGHAGDLIITIT